MPVGTCHVGFTPRVRSGLRDQAIVVLTEQMGSAGHRDDDAAAQHVEALFERMHHRHQIPVGP